MSCETFKEDLQKLVKIRDILSDRQRFVNIVEVTESQTKLKLKKLKNLADLYDFHIDAKDSYNISAAVKEATGLFLHFGFNSDTETVTCIPTCFSTIWYSVRDGLSLYYFYTCCSIKKNNVVTYSGSSHTYGLNQFMIKYFKNGRTDFKFSDEDIANLLSVQKVIKEIEHIFHRT